MIYTLLIQAEEGYDPEEYMPKTVDLDEDGAILLVAEGGKPGYGNAMMAGSKNMRAKSMVKYCHFILKISSPRIHY